MKKKIIYLLLTIILIFSVTDVYAREITLVFFVNCPESREAYRRWSGGKELTRSGRYTFHIPDGADMSNYPGYDDSGSISDSSSTQGCGPVAHNKLSCSFGCLESELEAATNSKQIKEVIGLLGDAAQTVGSYCYRVCSDKKRFYAPTGSNPDTVKQGGKFTWTNGFGHVLTFKDDRTCFTTFDFNGWDTDYKAIVAQINDFNVKLSQKTKNPWCAGDTESWNGKCRKLKGYEKKTVCDGVTTVDGKRVCENEREVDDKNKPIYSYSEPKECGGNYHYVNGTCLINDDYKNTLIASRKEVSRKLDGLISAAKSCENSGGGNPIAKCDNVTISYDDEVYGKILDQSAEYRKLIASGGSTGPYEIRSNRTSLTVAQYDECPNNDSECKPRSVSTMSFMSYKETKIETEYHWDLKSDLFSCIDINGKSYLSCAMAADAAPNRYITVGSNFPVSFNASTGVKNISINYGCSDATNATNGDACHYNVEKCPDNICAPVDPEDPGCVGEHCDTPNPPGGSIYAIYRTIDLNNPFPNRTPGDNWNKNDNAKTYIENNRGAKTEDVYSLEPLYKIELDPAKIKEIRKDNRNVDYGSFDNLTCTNGENCKSSYLNELVGKGYLTVNGG
mgnify:CR=1 FL=1